MGMFLLLAMVASRTERRLISEPHAALPSVPLSTKMKCVWCGLSGAPLMLAGLPRYDACERTQRIARVAGLSVRQNAVSHAAQACTAFD